jgi:hypothetical protein
VTGGPGLPEQLAVDVYDCCVHVEWNRHEPLELQLFPHAPQFSSSISEEHEPLQQEAPSPQSLSSLQPPPHPVRPATMPSGDVLRPSPMTNATVTDADLR